MMTLDEHLWRSRVRAGRFEQKVIFLLITIAIELAAIFGGMIAFRINLP